MLFEIQVLSPESGRFSVFKDMAVKKIRAEGTVIKLCPGLYVYVFPCNVHDSKVVLPSWALSWNDIHALRSSGWMSAREKMIA